MKNPRKNFSVAVAVLMLGMQAFLGNILQAEAANATVVINEIAWAGTAANGNDEWIELYNNSASAVDLSGWKIVDDNGASVYEIVSGEIGPRGYFVIEDSEAVLSGIANAVIGLSLANTGDSLVLQNASGANVDSVNASGGAWYAGNGTSKASMERIDPQAGGDLAGNWGNAVMENGVKDSLGGNILGTPGTVNSVFGGEVTEVSLIANVQNLSMGSEFEVSVNVEDVEELEAYGMEIVYDPARFNFVLAREGDFLKDAGQTTFQNSLKDGIEGHLLVAGAMLTNANVSGDGELFKVVLKVVGESAGSSEISFGAGNFLADAQSDMPAKFNKLILDIEEAQDVGSVVNLSALQGEERYSIELLWQAPSGGADKYFIYRETPDGTFAKIGEVTTLSFVDDDGVAGAGKIIPNVEYRYGVVAQKNGVDSATAEIGAQETRGIKGDNDRNDQVDGRDVRNLAKSYGSVLGESDYNVLFDTNFDGFIDGGDLIDIGSNFGMVYHP